MKKEMKIILSVVIAILVIAVIAILANTGTDKPQETITDPSVRPDGPAISDEVPEESRQLIEELLQGNERELQTITTVDGEAAEFDEEGTEANIREIRTVTIAAGTSGIDVERGVVVSQTGEVADNSTRAGTGNAPRASFPIDNPDELPNSTIRLEVTSSSFSPSEFTVRPGQLVNLAVTNVNDRHGSTLSEVFKFEDPSLAGILFGLAKGQTKSISFNAPTTPGEYIFYSNQFNHRAQGAEGRMIVQ